MYLIALRFTALLKVFLLVGFTLGGEKFVVGCLQVLHLFLGGGLVVVGKLLHPFQHFLPRGVYFLLGGLGFSHRLLGSCGLSHRLLGRRFFSGHGLFYHSRLCHGFLGGCLGLSGHFFCRLGRCYFGRCCFGGSCGLDGCLGVGIHYFFLFFLISLDKGILLRVHHVT